MSNGRLHQCPEGINLLIVSVTVFSEAKGRKSRMRRLITTLVPGDSVAVFDKEGIFLFELSVNCHGKVSTVTPLDK